MKTKSISRPHLPATSSRPTSQFPNWELVTAEDREPGLFSLWQSVSKTERRLVASVYDTNGPLADDKFAGQVIEAAPKLLAALRSVIDYAENESCALADLKDSEEAESEARKANKAVETARALLAQFA
jgi:hypothetical protein